MPRRSGVGYQYKNKKKTVPDSKSAATASTASTSSLATTTTTNCSSKRLKTSSTSLDIKILYQAIANLTDTELKQCITVILLGYECKNISLSIGASTTATASSAIVPSAMGPDAPSATVYAPSATVT